MQGVALATAQTEPGVQAGALTAALVAALVTAVAEAGMRRATAGMAQDEYGEGEYEVTEWPTPSHLLIAKRGSRGAFFI